MSELQPLVSVIMPAYNSGKYIKDSIQSVVNQHYKNWELIVIDDGSTDNTRDIVSRFSEQNNQIRLYKNETNKGLIQARNKGLELAKGEYIANLDSDDIAVPTRLEQQVSFLLKNPEYVLLGSAVDIINSIGKITSRVTRDLPNSHISTLLLFSNYFINSTTVMQASLAKEIKYAADIPLSEDYQLFVSLSKKGAVGNLKNVLVQYREHDTNISKEKEGELKRATQLIQRKQLIGMGVNPTDENLVLHSSLVEGNYIAAGFSLSQVENWLLKLIAANELNKIYPISIFNHYAAFFFRRACENSGSGAKSISTFRKSDLFNYIKKDYRGNSVFFVKSLFKSL